jgi:hypothetical protein
LSVAAKSKERDVSLLLEEGAETSVIVGEFVSSGTLIELAAVEMFPLISRAQSRKTLTPSPEEAKL